MRPRHPSRLTATVVTLIAILSGIHGCGSPDSGNDKGKAADGKPEVALIMKSLANSFFATMAEGAKRHQAENADKYRLTVNGIKDERDLARQVGLVEDMIAKGVEAIVIAPADSKALVGVLKRAQEAGIVVVNIDNKLDAQVLEESKIRVPFVGPDNRAGARMVGEHLAQRLKPDDKVVVLEGIRTAFNGQQRRLGFEDAMKAAEIEIVDSQSAEWETEKANRVASAMLSEHPEVAAMLCSNDNMALGALAAVKAAGRAGEIAIVGFDNLEAIRPALKDGSVLATADQHADQLAVYGIEYALQILQDGTVPEDKETPVDLITADTLE